MLEGTPMTEAGGGTRFMMWVSQKLLSGHIVIVTLAAFKHAHARTAGRIVTGSRPEEDRMGFASGPLGVEYRLWALCSAAVVLVQIWLK